MRLVERAEKVCYDLPEETVMANEPVLTLVDVAIDPVRNRKVAHQTSRETNPIQHKYPLIASKTNSGALRMKAYRAAPIMSVTHSDDFRELWG